MGYGEGRKWGEGGVLSEGLDSGRSKDCVLCNKILLTQELKVEDVLIIAAWFGRIGSKQLKRTKKQRLSEE